MTLSNHAHDTLTIKHWPQADYLTVHSAMSERTLDRIQLAKKGIRTPDELWVVEHNDVYTLGQAGKHSHILRQTDTPIIQTDRGGQVTWHGKGQLVVYWLFDLKSLGWGVRDLVSHAEQAIEDLINAYLPPTLSSSTGDISVMAKARKDAPGVYLYCQSHPNSDSPPRSDATIDPPDNEVMLGKIASLGFKIKHGMSYHGVAINLTCDLKAFLAINPCGYAGMTMLRLSDFVAIDTQQVTEDFIDNIRNRHQGKIALRPALGAK